MTKVITYGTYDLLHYGHIRLLERAKALGDYLVVGVTADSFDRARGKINVQQSLIERVESVKATGIADEIIIEEYEGQKIDDIRRLGIDIFTVGSDWKGHFDYLKDYCKVVYLDRTEGVSSSELRSEERSIRLGLVGDINIVNKFERESHFVNGITLSGVCSQRQDNLSDKVKSLKCVTSNIDDLLDISDAIYVVSSPIMHFHHVRKALERGKHVLCESPIALNLEDWKQLKALADQNGCILMESVKTAYSTAFYRMLLLAKSGVIGKILTVDSICTSLRDVSQVGILDYSKEWNSICAWGPSGLLPIFQLLGCDYNDIQIVTHQLDDTSDYDLFTKIMFVYPNAVASVKVGQGVKSEGELIISGTEGYIYVPAPWWKTDYFEIRFENPANNRRYFYQLDGEGIRYELVMFLKSIQSKKNLTYIDEPITDAIVKVMERYYSHKYIRI